MEHKIAISHASGLVAEAILEKLSESGITPDSLVLLDDESRLGTRLPYAGTYLGTLNQDEFDFSQTAVLLMPEVDETLQPRALEQGCLLLSHVLDQDSLPIFVSSASQQPEISYTDPRLRIAGAELSCLLPVLLELNRMETVVQLNLTFMQSAGFYGKAGVDELASQTVNLLNSREVKADVFQQQIAFNLLTTAGDHRLGTDLQYFFGNSAFSSVQQTVNVPVFHGLAVAIQIKFDADIDFSACDRRLSAIPNVVVKKSPISIISDCNQSFNCTISHLQQVPNQPAMLQFWMMADPMRYGLANNYVNVLEFLLKSFL